MRIVTAIVLAAASAGSAALVLNQDHWSLADRILYGDKSATAAAPSQPAPAAPAVQSQIARVFSSSQPLLKDPKSPTEAAGTQSSAATAPIGAPLASTSTAIKPVAAPATADPTIRRLASSRPADDDARHELVKDLQRELKRVGCFEGEVTGTWGPGSKKAMAAFTERVNATLPLDEPDYILLTLVQGHSERACGMGCPSGQAQNDGGKCVPRAVLAHRRDAEPSASAPGRSDNGTARVKPQPRAQPQAPAKVASAWSTVVAAPPAQQPDTSARVAAAPLPGRMAIGAPTDAADIAPERAAIEGTSRKAALAAAATLAMQRDAEAENERKKRLAEAQARKSRELALLQASAANAGTGSVNPAAAGSTKQPVTVAAIAPAVPSPATNPASEPTVATPARPAKRAPLQREDRKSTEFAQPAPRIATAPIRVPTPRLPPPYAVGRIVTIAPQPGYAPQPTRWTRTIFNDINRMR